MEREDTDGVEKGRMLREFRQFILRGNLIDLAVAVVIKPVNALLARLRPEPAVDQETRPCPECLSDIPVGARRCAFCTSALAAVA
jgi:hypothetical protein